MKSKLIIVAGCSGSGKTTVSDTILHNFKKGDAQIICMDRFYKKNASCMPKVAKNGHPNFDHPDSIDWKLLYKCMSSLLQGKPTVFPIYDYVHHVRLNKGDLIKPSKIVIFEGILALLDDKFNNLASLKLFVDTSIEMCFKRRLERDQVERGRTARSIKQQWDESVIPMYNKFVKPRRWVADLLLPWDKPNPNSLKYLSAAIKSIHK